MKFVILNFCSPWHSFRIPAILWLPAIGNESGEPHICPSAAVSAGGPRARNQQRRRLPTRPAAEPRRPARRHRLFVPVDAITNACRLCSRCLQCTLRCIVHSQQRNGEARRSGGARRLLPRPQRPTLSHTRSRGSALNYRCSSDDQQ